MPAERLWEILRDLGGSASAVGSFAALIAGIVLARRRSGLRLHVEAELRTPRSRKLDDDAEPALLWIAVTNRGSRPVTLQEVGWSFRLPDQRMSWTPPVNRLTTILPATLCDGGSANFVQPIDAFAASHGAILREKLAGRAGWVRSQLMEVHVIARSGERFSAPIQPALRRELLRIARAGPREDGSATES